MSRPSRSGRRNVIAGGVAGSLTLLVLGASGGAIAGAQIGSGQIVDNSIRSRDVRNGTLLLRDLDQSALAALPGRSGPPGPNGEPGAPGPAGVLQVVALVGPVPSISGQSGDYVFVGPSAQITTTSTHSRVIGSATASLGLSAGAPQLADVGMCYRPVAGGAVTNFFGSNYAMSYFTVVRATYAAAATKVLPPTTYTVGMCVRNNGGSAINNNSYVNGWVMVSS